MFVNLLETVLPRPSASQHAFWCLLVEAEDAPVRVVGADQGWLRSKRRAAVSPISCLAAVTRLSCVCTAGGQSASFLALQQKRMLL